MIESVSRGVSISSVIEQPAAAESIGVGASRSLPATWRDGGWPFAAAAACLALADRLGALALFMLLAGLGVSYAAKSVAPERVCLPTAFVLADLTLICAIVDVLVERRFRGGGVRWRALHTLGFAVVLTTAAFAVLILAHGGKLALWSAEIKRYWSTP